MNCPHGYIDCYICYPSDADRGLAALQRRLEEVERERDEWRRMAEDAQARSERDVSLVDIATRIMPDAMALAAERAAHAEARREQDIAARGRLDAEIRAERAEAALGDAVYHLRNLLAVVKGELGGLADCCDVNNAESLLDRLSPQPTPTKERG